MADREPCYLPPASRAFEEASSEDQQELDRIVRNLCENPWIDPPVKVAFLVPPAVVTLYNDGTYWVVYHLPDNRTLQVWMIGKATDDPRPY